MSCHLIKSSKKCSCFLLSCILNFILLFRIIRIFLSTELNQFCLLSNLNSYITSRTKILRRIRIKIKTSLKQALTRFCKNLNKTLSKIMIAHLQISSMSKRKCLFSQRKNMINIMKIIFVLVAENSDICPEIAAQKIKIKMFQATKSC